VRLSARADYAVRAAVELAVADPRPAKREQLAEAQQIPERFLGTILLDLKRAGIVATQRGTAGGYRLARSPRDITIADVIRAVDGPLANIRGERPERAQFEGSAVALRDVWIAVRASLRSVLEHVTLADVACGRLPEPLLALTRDADAWASH
jgi:Rrf2 family protein